MALFCKAQEVLGKVIKRTWGHEETEMVEVLTAEDVRRLGMSTEMIGTPKEPTFVAADPQAVTIDTLPPEMVYQDPEAGAIPRQTGLTPNYPLRPVASGPETPAPAAAGILPPPTQPAPSDDPFANLSKTQRQMLAFAAISDAGAALAGKQGGNFASTLSAFNDMADMQRKRTAALQQQQMLQRVMGGGASTTTGMMTPQDIDARLATLTQILATNPEMAPYVNAEMQRLMPLREETIKKQSEISQKENMLMQIDNLLGDAALDQALGIEGIFRKPLADLGLDPDTKRVRTKVEQLQGGVFLQAFESLKGGGQITELEGKKAEQAMARLNTVQDPVAFREAVNELRIITENGIRRLKGETVPEYTGPTQDQDPLGIRNR